MKWNQGKATTVTWQSTAILVDYSLEKINMPCDPHCIVYPINGFDPYMVKLSYKWNAQIVTSTEYKLPCCASDLAGWNILYSRIPYDLILQQLRITA